MTIVPEAHHDAGVVPADTVVFPGSSDSRFGDDRWEIGELARRAGAAERTVKLTDLPAGWALPVRELLFVMAQPTHEAVTATGLVVGRRTAPQQLPDLSQRLRTLSWWAHDADITSPSRWSRAATGHFLDDMRRGLRRASGKPLSPAGQAQYATALLMLWECRAALSDALTFDPWNGLTPARAVGYKLPTENLTSPLPWSAWSATVAACWFVVNELSADIIAASRKSRGPAPRTSVTKDDAVEAFREYLAGGGAVPVHTGYGRRRMPRGTLNAVLAARALGVSSSALNPSTRGFNAELHRRVLATIEDPSRRWYGGLYCPSGPHADPAWEWGHGEIEHLESILRGASYLLLAALTAMRDAELQALERGCRTTDELGVPGLRSIQRKGVAGPGRPRVWYAPKPVLRVVEVLEELSPHERLFARSPRGGPYSPHRDIARFVAWVNSEPCDRVGRGPALPIERIDSPVPLSQQTMRRSFAVYAARYPGAELGLGIQLGHAALRMTAGYYLDSQEQASRLFDDDRRALANELVRDIVDDTVVAGGDASDRIREEHATVVSSPTRAKRLIARLAENYHLGSLNDCHYEPERAACGSDGPHLAERLCSSTACDNAVVTDRHAPAWASHLERIDRHLAEDRLHPVLEDRLRNDRSQVVALLRRHRHHPES